VELFYFRAEPAKYSFSIHTFTPVKPPDALQQVSFQFCQR
jgi:hypothetical protein